MNQRVVVVGGGAAGTSAASSLEQKGYKVTIIEKNSNLGGRIVSVNVGEQCFEMGACFVSRRLYPNAFKILRTNNLNSDLCLQKTKTFLVKNAKAYSPISLLGSNVLPFTAKLIAIKQFINVFRHWQELSLKHLSDAARFDTSSVSELLSSKSEKLLLDNIVQPTLNGYLYWTPEKTSQAMLMILAKSVLHTGRSYTLKHGLQQLPKAMAKNCRVISAAEVIDVEEYETNGFKIVYKKNGKTESIIADGVVCATTASVAPKIIKNLTNLQKEFLSSIKYSSAVVVANVYKQLEDMPNYQHAYPRIESQDISSITSQTIRNENGNNQVVKVFSSGEKAPELLSKSDADIKETLKLPDLSIEKLEINSIPENVYIHRWGEALPELSVGYFKNLKKFIGEEDKSNKRLVFAGDYLGGPYVEGAITSGLNAAELLHGRLLQ